MFSQFFGRQGEKNEDLIDGFSDNIVFTFVVFNLTNFATYRSTVNLLINGIDFLLINFFSSQTKTILIIRYLKLNGLKLSRSIVKSPF
jgi:hypothetical protein